MRTYLAGLAASVLLLAPAAASAATLEETQQSLRYLLAQLVALTADRPAACSAWASANTVKVGQPFTFAWFAAGSNALQQGATILPPSGVVTLAIDKPGLATYTLKFSDAAGVAASCTAAIAVLR